MIEAGLEKDVELAEKFSRGIVEITRLFEIQYQYNPRKLVYQHDKVKLYHYESRVKSPHAIPVLVVFATVNRPEILDLFPEHSFIGELLQNRMDVYLLDWGYPDIQDNNISIDNYVSDYLHNCVKHVLESSQQEKINLVGICQGGVICLCYSILNNDYIKNLVLISSPIDFHTPENVIGSMFRQLDVDSFIALSGNVSGLWLTNFFISLRPFELVGKKYLRFVDNVDDKEWIDRFLRVEKWLYDAPDQTGASFKQLITNLYQQNNLIKGDFRIKNQYIDLSKLTIPVLNIMAGEDEIVPMSATNCLNQYISSTDYTQKIFPSGHIGIYISDKVGKTMPKEIARWLIKR